MDVRPGGADRSPTRGGETVEPFGGGTGFRFRIRDVRIDGRGHAVRVRAGGSYELDLELLHDCPECGNAVNQVIVGLAGQDRAQASVWNGEQRSGGPLHIVNPWSHVAALAEDDPGVPGGAGLVDRGPAGRTGAGVDDRHHHRRAVTGRPPDRQPLDRQPPDRQPSSRPEAACRTTSTCRSSARFCQPAPSRRSSVVSRW